MKWGYEQANVILRYYEYLKTNQEIKERSRS